MIQATQIPNAPSKKENNAKTPAITNETELPNTSKDRTIRLVKISPTRAAKIFGPALIRLVSVEIYFTMFREVIPIRLYFEYCVALKRKSTLRKTIRSRLCESPKVRRINTVITALVRATLSLILFSDIGQKAFVFIILIFRIVIFFFILNRIQSCGDFKCYIIPRKWYFIYHFYGMT